MRTYVTAKPPQPTPAHADPTAWPSTVLSEICHLVNADAAEAELIKFTNNAVYALPSSGLVVRISGSETVARSVHKVVDVARWLAAHDMPTVRLATKVTQPVKVEGHTATIWELVPTSDRTVTGHDLGGILRRFHALTEPPPSLPPWNTLGAIRSRLEHAGVLTSDEHAFLTDTAAATEEELARLDYFLEPGPIHGDVFVGNLIAGPNGPVLCDFDSTSIGPREWDLTPAAVGRLRFAYPVDYHGQIAEAYGVDILAWPGFPTLRRLRELQLVCSVLPILETNPSLREQWRHRFDTFRCGDLDARWTTYV